MALNKFMHPRNIYKNNRPNFKKLALEHEEFRKVAKQSMDGKVSIDFKDSACLRALSQALLKCDFGLSVELPSDRLVPALPQRLNYILWLEDIFCDESQENLVGIDVGCGSSCIYPLLGHQTNKWRFITTEIDSLNLKYARENVERNHYGDMITVLQADDTILKLAVDSYDTNNAHTKPHIDFCMCNPPFFDSVESVVCRDARADPKHVSTAGPTEKMVAGGEVDFVKKMIDESLELQHRIRVYTSMVGKKSSLSKLKQYLRSKNVSNFSTTEFCQGRTMRWAIAWSFLPHTTFPKSLFQQERSRVKSALIHTIPPEIQGCLYDVPDLTHFIKCSLFKQLQMKSTTLHQDVGEYVCIVTARSNTWSHNRRKRRMAKIQQAQLSNQAADSNVEGGGDQNEAPPCKKLKTDDLNNTSAAVNTTAVTDMSSASSCEDSSSDEKPLITFSLELKLEGIHIKLHLKLIDCDQKDMLHQILQYFKNRLV